MDKNSRKMTFAGKVRNILPQRNKRHIIQNQHIMLEDQDFSQDGNDDPPPNLESLLHNIYSNREKLSGDMIRSMECYEEGDESYAPLKWSNRYYDGSEDAQEQLLYLTVIADDYIEPLFDPDNVDDTKDPDIETDEFGVEVYVNPIEEDNLLTLHKRNLRI